jgi:hypothetical protein
MPLRSKYFVRTPEQLVGLTEYFEYSTEDERSNMKRIGIVTWFMHQNYGQVLQAFALQTSISKLGFEPELINYHPSIVTERTTGIFEANLRRLPHITASRLARVLTRELYQLYCNRISSRKRLFKAFVKSYLKVSQEVTNINQLSSLYEGFICGSDQIWAPTVFNEYYYLSFETDPKRKISYAPSFGLNTIPKNISEQVAALLYNIKNLSVREETGASLVEELIGKKPHIVVDPTLLLDAEQWSQVASRVVVRCPFILCYFLGNNPEHRAIVNKIKQETGLHVVILPFNTGDLFRKGFAAKSSIGPREFLSLVSNAELICTDSYHGILFSINYNKPFLAFKRFSDEDPVSQNSRVNYILGKYGLWDRLVIDKDELCYNKRIDYSKVNKLLKVEREHSKTFLESSLAGIGDRFDNL